MGEGWGGEERAGKKLIGCLQTSKNQSFKLGAPPHHACLEEALHYFATVCPTAV